MREPSFVFSVTLSLGEAAAIGTAALLSLVIWAAVFARDSDRREAAQRVLAMVWRRNHIPTVQPARTDVVRGERRLPLPSRHRGVR